jgi:hypothetical protein
MMLARVVSISLWLPLRQKTRCNLTSNEFGVRSWGLDFDGWVPKRLLLLVGTKASAGILESDSWAMSRPKLIVGTSLRYQTARC